MAEDPVAPRDDAANVSRRSLLGGLASSPLAGGFTSSPGSRAEWERVVKTFAAAHYRHEAFRAASLAPAYRGFHAGVGAARRITKEEATSSDLGELRQRIGTIEQGIIDAGGDRTDVVRLRKINTVLAQCRAKLADALHHVRQRRRLMRRYNILALEEESNEMLSLKHGALRELLRTPALDKAGLILKVRLGYQEFYCHEDDDGTLRAIFADVERLCG